MTPEKHNRDDMKNIQGLIRGLRQRIARILLSIDQKILYGYARFFRVLYKITFLRPIVRPVYAVVRHNHRITSLVLAAIILFGICMPVLQPLFREDRYNLEDKTKLLLGESDKDLSKKLTFDHEKQLYQFNKDAIKDPVTNKNPMGSLTQQIGGGGADDKQLYSVDAAKNLAEGVTYHDTEMQLSFKVVPQFETLPGEMRSGHIIYPLKGMNGQLAYTVTPSGMKENVVLQESPSDELKMSYKLELPKSLEARMIKSTGDIGIYSADPMLFGNITYGSSDDKAKIERVRNESEKTYLAFTLPAPYVLGVDDKHQTSKVDVGSKFELRNNTLTVHTTGLDNQKYPLTIDPTIVVDNTNNFLTGNIEDNNVSIANGDLKRGSPTDGLLEGWSATTSLPVSLTNHSSVVYNGYIYLLGGDETVAQTFTASGNYTVPSGVTSVSVVANGAKGGGSLGGNGGQVKAALAVTGGETLQVNIDQGGGTSGVNYGGGSVDVRQGGTGVSNRKIVAGGGGGAGVDGSNGEIAGGAGGGTTGGTGQAGISNFDCEPGDGGTASAGGGGGYNYSSPGTLMSGGAGGETFGSEVIAGGGGGGGYYGGGGGGALDYGCAGGGGGGSSFLGSGTSSASHIQGFNSGPGSVKISYTTVATNKVYFAPLNSDGTVGSWTATTSFSGGRNYLGAVVYNNSLFVIGGSDGGAGSYSDVQSAGFYPNGSLTSWTASSATLPVGRSQHAAVAYNGYLYVTGGAGSSTFSADVLYAPIHANGTVGSWTATTSFTDVRIYHMTTVYNGYMYVIGGLGQYYSALGTAQYARINADGTVGSWMTTNAPVGRFGASVNVYNGYMYVTAGTKTGFIFDGTTEYAPIYSSGRLGAWSTTTSLSSTRALHKTVVYNGYIYTVGGSLANSAGTTDLVEYAKIAVPSAAGYQAGTNMNEGRGGHTLVAYNSYLYYIAGSYDSASAARSSVYYAPINTNGSIGSWAATTSLNTARVYHTSVVNNGYIYALGGRGTAIGGSTLASTEYAQINSNGTLGAWTTTTAIPIATHSHASTIYNSRVYVTGGTGSGNNYYATLNSNGTIGTWAVANTLSTRYGHTVEAYNGKFYMLGGYYGSATNTVYYATINSDGTMSDWTALTSFTTGRYYHTSFIHNGSLYITGGEQNTSTYYSDMQTAAIAADGTLGSWTTVTAGALPSARHSHATTVYNGTLYLAGGVAGTTFINSTHYLKLASLASGLGAIGAWTSTTANGLGVYGVTAAAHNGYIYTFGGFAGSNAVRYAPLNVDGTIGTWVTAGNLAQGTHFHSVVIYDGYVYITGGQNSGQNVINTVQFAPINSDGSLGTWATTTAMTQGRYGHGSVANNGYLYVLSGSFSSGLTDVLYAPINSNGSVGSWSSTTALPATRTYFEAEVYNGYLYAVGGSGATTSVIYTTFNTNGTLNSWTTNSTTIPTGVYGHTVEAVDGYMYITGGAIITNTYHAPINSNGSIGTWQSSTAMPISRYYHASAVYNGYIYVLNGSSGSGGTNVSYYAPLSSIAKKANYTKTLGLGFLNRIKNVNYTGVLAGGIEALQFRVAGDDGVFGAWQSAATATGCNVSGKYVQVQATIDDSKIGTLDDTANTNNAIINSISIEVEALGVEPQKRLRHGAHFNSELLQPFDLSSSCN